MSEQLSEPVVWPTETVAPQEPQEPQERDESAERVDDNLVLDDWNERLSAFKLLTKSDTAAADELLEQVGARGKVEQDILLQMAAFEPLWLPERFEQAHRSAIRALEVLDRNGARSAELPRLGPLAPVAGYFVQLFTRWIVRSHQGTVVDNLRHLYGRREANAVPGSPEYHMLRRSRIHAERLGPGLKRNPLGVPTFLLGGAFIGSAVSALRESAASALDSPLLVALLTLLLFGAFFGLSWVMLRAAAIARRRIRLTLDRPLAGLYETIGACGDPPKDQARQFALYAIIVTAVAWIVIPAGIVAALAR